MGSGSWIAQLRSNYLLSVESKVPCNWCFHPPRKGRSAICWLCGNEIISWRDESFITRQYTRLGIIFCVLQICLNYVVASPPFAALFCCLTLISTTTPSTSAHLHYFTLMLCVGGILLSPPLTFLIFIMILVGRLLLPYCR